MIQKAETMGLKIISTISQNQTPEPKIFPQLDIALNTKTKIYILKKTKIKFKMNRKNPIFLEASLYKLH